MAGSTTDKTISVIVPAYNEKDKIAAVISSLKDVLGKGGYKHEIIVIDDGSTDGTQEILKGITGIKLIVNESNSGYGYSLKRGFSNASHDIAVIIDADGTYPADKIPELVSHMDRYDMVVGARTSANVYMPPLRKAMKKILNMLANYLSGKDIPDLNSGLRVIKRDIVKRFFNILPSGFSFTTTITLALLTNDYAVKYVPIDYAHRKKLSKFHPVKDTANMFMLIIRAILYFNPLKIFMPIGLFMIAAGIIVFITSMIFLPKILDATTTVLVTVGIQTIVIGLLADLIDKKLR